MAVSNVSDTNVPPSTARRRPPPERRYCPSGGGAGEEACPAAGAAAPSVRFNPETRVYLIPVHWEMPEEDRVHVWYSPRALEGLTKDVRKTVRHMRRRLRESARSEVSLSSFVDVPLPEEEEGESDSLGICKRGLEHLQSSAHMEQRKINRDCSQKAVFDEQTRQREAGINDLDELRRASQSGSEWSKKTALKMGRADEEAARRILALGSPSPAGGGGGGRAQRRRYTTVIPPTTSSTAPSHAHSSRCLLSTSSAANAVEDVDVPNEELLQRAMELCIATDCSHPFCRRPSRRLSKASSSSSAAAAATRSKSVSPPRALQIAPASPDATAGGPTASSSRLALRRSLSDRKNNTASSGSGGSAHQAPLLFRREHLSHKRSASLSAGERLLSGASAKAGPKNRNNGIDNLRSGLFNAINGVRDHSAN